MCLRTPRNLYQKYKFKGVKLTHMQIRACTCKYLNRNYLKIDKRKQTSYLYSVVFRSRPTAYPTTCFSESDQMTISFIWNSKYVGKQRIGASTNDRNIADPQWDKTHVASLLCGCLKIYLFLSKVFEFGLFIYKLCWWIAPQNIESQE